LKLCRLDALESEKEDNYTPSQGQMPLFLFIGKSIEQCNEQALEVLKKRAKAEADAKKVKTGAGKTRRLISDVTNLQRQ